MAGKVNVPISVAIQGLANTQKQLSALSSGISGVGRSAAIAGVSFAAFAIGIKTADFFSQAIAGARDLERNVAGLKSVFESLTPQMTEFSKQAVNVGLSLGEASKASTFIGSVLKQSGFSIKETADLTERLVKLGTDLSLTYGYDVQEALMGMTALFRGEYDPIEKFGVAMKQSEINSELAARGLDGLTGSARRFAEQQIRVDFLFQRSADAQGAFERQSGTLAAEQLKLAAAFANMRDTVAVGLLPAIGSLLAEFNKVIVAVGPELQSKINMFGPKLERLIQNLVPVFEAVAEGILDALDGMIDFFTFVEDNWSVLSALATGLGAATIAFNVFTGAAGVASGAATAFFTTVTAHPFGALLAGLAGITVGAMTAINSISDIDPEIQEVANRANTMGSAINKMLPGFESISAEAERAARYLAFLKGRVLELNTEFVNTTSITGILKASGLSMADFIKSNELPELPDTKAAVTDYVKEFFNGMKEEVRKQQARLKLEGLGASEGLIDQILGSQGWEKVFKRVLASGTEGIKRLQTQFNRTAAGIKELDAIRKAAEEDALAYIKEAQDAADELTKAWEDAKVAAEDFKRSMAEISQVNVLPTIETELGDFENAVVGTFESIRAELAQGLYDKRIFQADYDTLMAYVATEERALRSIQRQRDDLAKRSELSRALISEYRQALTASLQLTNLLGNVKTETEKKVITETTKGIMRLGKSLREFEITVTRQFEQTVEETKSKTENVLTGFRDMAAKARLFGENLRKLRALGLDDQLFAQLIQAGVEAGGETAQALVDGGSATINEINSLFREIDALGAGLGEEVAATLYGTGIDMTNGLIAGIQSKQTELENLARSMAEAFNREFSAKLSIAVDQPVKAAEAAQAAAQAAVPKLEQINLDALAKINGLIAGAERFIKNTSNAFQQIGAEDKLDIYKMVREDILQGKAVDISGIRSGMSTAELEKATGKSVVNNITINATVDATQSPAMVGKQIGTIITSYVQTGGQVAV